jgi:hypothetical protein
MSLAEALRLHELSDEELEEFIKNRRYMAMRGTPTVRYMNREQLKVALREKDRRDEERSATR